MRGWKPVNPLFLLPLMMVSGAARDSTIAGRVTDASTDTPVAGATVTLRLGGQTTTTDAAGSYSFSGVKPGDYRVSARMEGYGIGPSGDSSPMRRIRVGAGLHVRGVDFKLQREAILQGRVLDSDRHPVPGITVAVFGETYINGRLDFWTVKTVRTDPKGEYKVIVPAKGRWYLGAFRSLRDARTLEKGEDGEEHRDTALVTFFHNASSPLSAQPVHAIPGSLLDGIDLVLPLKPVFCISGSVSAMQEGSPLSITLRAREEDWRSSVLAQVQSNGPFQFCGVPTGSYVVRMTLGTPKGAFACLGQEFVEVGKRDVDLGKLICQPAQAVSGRMVLQDAQPNQRLPENLHVSLGAYGRRFGLIGENAGARVQPVGGAFSLPQLFTLPYWGVRVDGLPAGYYVKEASMGSRDPRREPVSPGMGDLVVVLARDGGEVTGQVVDDGGQPVADAIAVLTPETLSQVPHPRQVLSQVADQDGRFEFNSLAPGKYRLLAFRDLTAGQSEDPNFLRPHLSRAVEVGLEPRQNQHLMLKLQTSQGELQ